MSVSDLVPLVTAQTDRSPPTLPIANMTQSARARQTVAHSRGVESAMTSDTVREAQE